MKNGLLIFLVLSLLTISYSCSNEICVSGRTPIVTEDLDIADFDKIEVFGHHNVTIKQSNMLYVKAKGHQNIVDAISTEVVDGEWEIKFKKGCFEDYELDLTIGMPLLKEIDIKGSAEVNIGTLQNQISLDASIKGSGQITIEAMHRASSIDANITGSGTITLSNGWAGLQKIDLQITGSGNFLASNCPSNEGDIHITGSGNAKVNIMKALDVSITGSGNVTYTGEPEIKKSITGSGNVSKG